MRIWKQCLTSLAVLCCGTFLWIWLVPGAGPMLQALGLPGPVIAAITPNSAATGEKGGAGQPARGEGRRNGDGPPLVVVSSVAKGTVNDRLNAIGSGEAIRSVTITPQVAGTISEVAISSGEKVTKGQVLVRLDNAEQLIARDQANVALRSAVEKSQLYRNIKSTVSRMDVFNAEIAEEAAKLALDTAEFNLKRREITAPIEGVVGIVTVNVGDNVDTGTSLALLDDRSEILVDFWAPERFISMIRPGMPVEATAVARRGEIFEGTIEAVDNRVDEASRTLRIRARIANDNDELRSGMSFAVSMRFAGQDYPAVDPLAVQWDSNGAYVWRIAGDKAQKVPVSVIQRNPESVLVKAELRQGDTVAIEGLLRIRQESAVRISGAPAQMQAEVTP